MTMRIAIRLAALGVICLLFGGCTARSVDDDPIMLDVSGPVAVDVESFNGDVEILVTDEVDQAIVSVTRVNDFGHKREKEAVEALDTIKYSATLEPGDIGPVLTVRTWTDWPEPHYQKANVLIELPAAENIRVRTVRGDVTATDIQGTVDVETRIGDARVMTKFPMTKAVTIRNTEGEVHYRVRGESTGRIVAETVDGEASIRALYGDLLIKESNDHRFIAILNRGTNPVNLRSVQGDVGVAIVADPSDVGTFIFDP